LGQDAEFFFSGRSLTDEFCDAEERQMLKDYKSKVESGETYEIDFRINVNGEVKWIREKSFPILDDNGVVIKNSGICSDITNQKHNELSLNKVLENTKLLGDLGLELSSEIDLVRFIEHSYKKINDLMDADTFGIAIKTDKANELKFPLFLESNKRYENHFVDLSSSSLASYCFNNIEKVLINDSETQLKDYLVLDSTPLAGEITQSIIYLPLSHNGEVIGVITVQSFTKNAYDDYSISLLNNLSGFLSSGIQNSLNYSRMEEEIQRRTEEIVAQKEKIEQNLKQNRILSDIGYEISNAIDLEEIFNILYSNITTLIEVPMFGVRMINYEKNVIQYHHEFEGGIRQSKVEVSLEDVDNYSVYCALHNKPILISNNDQEYTKYVKMIKVPIGEMPMSLVFYPLTRQNKVIGVITMQHLERNAFNNEHLDILKNLALFTSSAIEKASILDSLERKVVARTKMFEDLNHDLVESINYAKQIQDNVLPSDHAVDAIFKDNVKLNLPKDILSGDFYLVDEIKTNDGNVLSAFIVGDCTGHGVPGGILSVLCSNLLIQTFKNSEVTSPADALSTVSEQLSKLFNDNKGVMLRDGMDASFCVIDKTTNTLYFAGANHRCTIVRNGELKIIKGDRQHVGHSENAFPFTTKSFALEANDMIYLTTDGYVDQFGGPKRKKFMVARFGRLLQEIAHLDTVEQEKKLFEVYSDWKGSLEQTDDVCVFGVRFNH
jgi:serine phosphatase RsbU (regulator of sigma subunit)/GAF domain-containing protein